MFTHEKSTHTYNYIYPPLHSDVCSLLIVIAIKKAVLFTKKKSRYKEQKTLLLSFQHYLIII